MPNPTPIIDVAIRAGCGGHGVPLVPCEYPACKDRYCGPARNSILAALRSVCPKAPPAAWVLAMRQQGVPAPRDLWLAQPLYKELWGDHG